VASEASDLVLRATTRRLVFEGYQAAYATSLFRKALSSDDEEDDDAGASLLASGFPDLKVPPPLPVPHSPCEKLISSVLEGACNVLVIFIALPFPPPCLR